MPNYHSRVEGGFFQNPETSQRHVSIRTNNPGAVNGASWLRAWPGYVKDVKYDGKNNTTIFETPEDGVAVWWDLMRKYRDMHLVTIKDIVWHYGGGQANYESYGKQVAKWMNVSDSTVINIDDDKSLLPFAKAMFRYEAGETPPWSDEQILFGFKIGRQFSKTHTVPTSPTTPKTPVVVTVTAGAAAGGLAHWFGAHALGISLSAIGAIVIVGIIAFVIHHNTQKGPST